MFNKKEYNKEYNKKYYKINKEKKKAYREANKEFIKSTNKLYYDSNKEKISPKHKAYYNLNRDKINLKSKEYYEDNKEKISLRNKQHNRTIKGRYNASKSNAKARNIDFDLSIEQYQEIIKDNKCHYCNNPLPEAGSGLDRKNNEHYYKVENSAPCCERCNAVFSDWYNYKEKLILAEAIKDIDCLRKVTKV